MKKVLLLGRAQANISTISLIQLLLILLLTVWFNSTVWADVEQQKAPQKISGQDHTPSPRAGRRLSTSEATELEEMLEEYPDDLAIRSKLLGYYFYRALRIHGRTATLEDRRYHIYWLIKNHPGSKLAGTAEITIDPIGHKLADKEGYEVAKQLWAEQVEKNKTDKKILLNAAHFLRLHDKEDAEEYLRRVNDPLASAALAELYALGALKINMMNQNGFPLGIGTSQKDYSFAKKARQALEESSDVLMLSMATSFLLTRGAMLKAMSGERLDIDPVEYAARLIRRQEELCPSCGTHQWSQYYEIKRMMAPSAEQKQIWAKREFVELEKSWKLANNQRHTDKKMKRTYDVIMLGKLAKAAFAAGEMTKARDYAGKLLKTESAVKGDKRNGRTTHDGNIILGRVALKQGDIKKAGEHLIMAGQISGGAALSSFGPNMALAKELLEHGEKEVVLQYLELCKKFWSRGEPELERWSATIKKGGMPNFGANLVY
jgi:hypothetical protein